MIFGKHSWSRRVPKKSGRTTVDSFGSEHRIHRSAGHEAPPRLRLTVLQFNLLMLRSGACLLWVMLSACGSLPVRNDPTSTDFYGMDPGLVRIYRAHFAVCGKPHDHYMQKKVLREISLAQGRAVVVSVAFPDNSNLDLHGMPLYSEEVFTETEAGFGYYDLKPGEEPNAAEAKRIDVEVPKPVKPGTRLKFEQGEIILEGMEDVTVGAGRFVNCIRVRSQFKDDANLFWFAPGVGMIRGYSQKKGRDGRPMLEFELLRLTRS